MTGTTLAPAPSGELVLLEAARHGDLHAWERVVRQYQEPLYRVAWLITRDSDMAEKATLSAFVRAYRALPSYDPELGLMPWLIRIVAGEARQQRREAGRPVPTSRPVEKVHTPQYPATVIPGLAAAAGLSPWEKAALSEAFDRLGEEDRLVIAARYLLGLNRSDAAAALSMSTELLDERLREALTRLRTRMVAA